jgi:hypothetical protein
MLDQIRAWLGKHKETTMDKDKAMKRLDAIEKEAKELRKIIDGKLEYDSHRLYVGIYEENPYIMTGSACDECFKFFTLGQDLLSEQCYASSKTSGQECLDYHIEAGFDIHVFDDTKKALQFFIDNL